ncbi:MAG: DUF1801 domain-containing protein [Candidatus Doudnabacteria bacterium]|nr:DUF1801 domain-containing protein [Candidatus Doudnabacteria bacterium]
MNKAKNVDEYITRTPKEGQGKLKQLRALIKKIAPDAEERISYGMPFYDYKGRLVYFAAMRGYIGLYIPPPIIADHAKELKIYVTTKSAIHLPPTKLPFALIKKKKKKGQEQLSRNAQIKKYPCGYFLHATVLNG